MHEETVMLSSEELTVLSDVLRRVRSLAREGVGYIPKYEYQSAAWTIFASRDEFTTAAKKLEDAKFASYRTRA